MAFNAHYEAVSRYCHRRLASQDANDATAEVFAVVWRKIDSLPPDDDVLPWLYAVARNEVSTARRSVRRFSALRTKVEGQAKYHEPGPEVHIVRNAEQERLLQALSTLRPDDQEILRLRAYEDLTHPQIAIVLGCSPEAARKRTSRAIKRLQRAAGIAVPGALAKPRAMHEGSDG